MQTSYVEEPVSNYIRAAVSTILSIHDQVRRGLPPDNVLADLHEHRCTCRKVESGSE